MMVKTTRTVFAFEGGDHATVSVLANCDLDAEMIEAIEAFLKRQKRRQRTAAATRSASEPLTSPPAHG